jgi:uncharacterized protein YndB with AHSA1/START domain
MRGSPDGAAIELEFAFSSPPSTVFPFFVDPERHVKWQGIKADLDPRPGGLFRVWMHAGTIARGEFIEVDEPRRVVYSWGWEDNTAIPPGSTRVELNLSPHGDEATILSLRHSGLPPGESADLHAEGWTYFMSRLESVSKSSGS